MPKVWLMCSSPVQGCVASAAVPAERQNLQLAHEQCDDRLSNESWLGIAFGNQVGIAQLTER
jgi:hypothetical protein